MKSASAGKLFSHSSIEWRPFQQLPDGLPPVPKLDPILIPESLQPWAIDIAHRMQCPIDFLGSAIMVCLGSVVGRQIGIRPQQFDDWTVVPNLWGAIIGRPGVLKTPALAEILRPLKELEANARKSHVEAIQKHEAESMVRAANVKQAEKEIREAIKSGNQEKANMLALQATQGAGEIPDRKRYITQDSSVEKLGELLAANPRGILVFRDELVGWLRSLERQGQEGARSFYLEAWNGTGGYTYDRIGRGTIDIEAACVSVLGGIQPGPLGSYVRETLAGGNGDDGLIQRLQLVVWPDPPRDWENNDKKPSKAARERANEVFFRLNALEPEKIGAYCNDGLPHLRFDEQAQEAWKDWRLEFEYDLRNLDEHPAFEAALAKQRSLLPSLALLIHLADHPEGGPVTNNSLQIAMDWVEYLEAHSKRLYGPALNSGLHAAKELAKHIRKGDLSSPFQARTVYLKGWSGLDKSGTDEALETLHEYGWLGREEIPTKGRPRTDWHISQKVHNS